MIMDVKIYKIIIGVSELKTCKDGIKVILSTIFLTRYGRNDISIAQNMAIKN